MLSVRGMRCTSPDLFTYSNVFQYGAADRGGRYNMIPVTACWSRTAPAAYCIYTILKHTDCIETVHPSTWKSWVHSRGVAYALVCFNMVHRTRIELVFPAWKASVLTDRRTVHRTTVFKEHLHHQQNLLYRFHTLCQQLFCCCFFTTGAQGRIRTDGFRVLQTLALGHSATCACIW